MRLSHSVKKSYTYASSFKKIVFILSNILASTVYVNYIKGPD